VQTHPMRILSFIFILGLFACQKAAQQDAAPTFSDDIAPIIFSNCVPCHRAGGPGPFPLTTYNAVSNRARQIAEVTASRYMPPWQPTVGYGSFIGERRLTEHQVALIQQWAQHNAPAGDLTQLPSLPQFTQGWQLGTPDLVVEMDEAYILPAEGADQFRNFVLPVPIDSTRYIEAVEFRTDQATVIHHAVLMFDRSGAARKHDAREAGPGFDGMVFGEAQGPDGHFLGWTPGKQPYRDPSLAWELAPGTDLVVQLHMLPSGRPEHVSVRVGFYYAEGPPERTPALLRLGRKDIDIPAGKDHYTLRDEFTLPVDVHVAGIYPHAHYLGKQMAVYADLPDGHREWLIRIDNWDFNWQDDYRYAQPVYLPRGAKIVMEYAYDNSAENPFNPHNPPQRIFYGLHSSNEMGDMTLQVVPRNNADLKTLQQHYARKWITQEIQGYETMLLEAPNHAEHHHTLAMLYLRVRQISQARTHFEACLNLRPDYAEARVNYAIALSAAGQTDKVIEQLRQAVAHRPDYADAHFNLAMALYQTGEPEAAKVHFTSAARLRPERAEAIRSHMERLQLH